jgi:hypothetical protein
LDAYLEEELYDILTFLIDYTMVNEGAGLKYQKNRYTRRIPF